jgi:hypothetical protein
MSIIRYFLASIFIVVTTLATAQKEERVALVIGIKEYKYVAPLQNTLNDAKDMSATLKKKGFRVVELYDPQTKREMQDAVMKYFKMIKEGTVGLVFYAGHGVQVEGSNYLIPAAANPMIKADLEDQCMSMDYVMGAIEEAGNPLNIFILDACRNNPFRSFSRSAGRGLNTVSAPKGSYVVYSTKPGSVASDGTGRNGLFTSKLLKYINTPGLNIEQVFKKVAGDVSAESGGDQRPWISSDYTDDFFFIAGKQTVIPVANNEPVIEPNYVESLSESGFNFSGTTRAMQTVGGQNGDAKIECFIGGEIKDDAYRYTALKINRSEYWGGQIKNGYLNGFVLMTVDGDKKSDKENILAYFVNGRILYPFIKIYVDDEHLGVDIQEENSSYGCLRSGPKYNWSSVDERPICGLMKEIFGDELFSTGFMAGFQKSVVDLRKLEKKFKDFVKLKTGKSI